MFPSLRHYFARFTRGHGKAIAMALEEQLFERNRIKISKGAAVYNYRADIGRNRRFNICNIHLKRQFLTCGPRTPPRGACQVLETSEWVTRRKQYFSLYLFPIYIYIYTIFLLFYLSSEWNIVVDLSIEFSKKEKKLFMDPYMINSKD